MRIRKRFPPSCLSSAASPDPQLNSSPMVQQNLLQTTLSVNSHGNPTVKDGQTHSQPSDPIYQPLPLPTNQHVMVGNENRIWVSSNATDLDFEEKDGKSNDTPRVSLSRDRGRGRLAPAGCHQVVERFYEEGKTDPLKKPRGRRTKMKLKSDYMDVKEMKESIGNSTTSNSSGESMKKSKRSGLIMEGSRCSRVNGRGWRCNQQTLVGYSLCEHHLGKGRLRCITRFAPPNHDDAEISSTSPLGGCSNEDDEKKVTVVTKKRKRKLGVVKARSMSSILGQTNNGVGVVAEHNKTGG